MITSQALHLGFFIIPWSVMIILAGSIAVFLSGAYFKSKQQWSDVVWQCYKDSMWTSVWVGLLAARVVFVLSHYDLYIAQPIEIIKVQDKGFNFYAGVLAACLCFIWKNYTLKVTVLASAIILFILTQVLGLSILKSFEVQQQYPNLSFTVLKQPLNPTSNLTSNLTTTPPYSETAKQPLVQFLGKPTVINLWASWCPPCHREMPLFNRAQSDHPNVQFVFINQGESADLVSDYLQRNQLNLKHVLLDPAGDMATSMSMFGMPSTLFFNANGELIDKHLGELSSPMLKQYIQKMTIHKSTSHKLDAQKPTYQNPSNKSLTSQIKD